MAKNIKWIIKVLLSFYIIIFGVIVLIDYNNWSFQNMTINYDWLAFIGAGMSGMATLILGIIALSLNEKIAEKNNDLIINQAKINGHSKIKFHDYQYFYMDRTTFDKNGFAMVLIDDETNKLQQIDEDSAEQFRFFLNIEDLTKMPLKDFHIEKMIIEPCDDSEFRHPKKYEFKVDNKNYYALQTNYKLVVDEDKLKDLYLATICLYTNKKAVDTDNDGNNIYKLNDLRKKEFLRLTFTASIRNAFNIETIIENEIVVKKTNNPGVFNTKRYDIHKDVCIIHYAEIKYKDE